MISLFSTSLEIILAMLIIVLVIGIIFLLKRGGCHQKQPSLNDANSKETTFHSSIINHLPFPIFIRENSFNNNMHYMSNQIFEITGYPASDFVSNSQRSFSSIIVSTDALRVTEALKEASNQKSLYSLYYDVQSASGETITLLEIGHSIVDETHNSQLFYGVLIPATLTEPVPRSTTNETETSIDDSLASILRTLNHDYNNIIAAIMGSAQLLLSPKVDLNERGLKYADIILTATKRAISLTDKLYSLIPQKAIDTPVPEALASPAPQINSILLVDDEQILLESGIDILEDMGYSVQAASTGSQALDIVKHSPNNIDLIITDLNLPELSGRELLNRVKEINPSIKILITSGAVSPKLEKELLSEGASQVHQKPYVFSDMLSFFTKAHK